MLDVFGVHLRAPTARYDGMGLVPLLRGAEVVSIGTNHATVRQASGSCLTVLKRTLKDSVPIWQLPQISEESTE